MQVKTAAREMGQKAKQEKLVKYCVSVLINRNSLLLKNSYMFSCTSHIQAKTNWSEHDSEMYNKTLKRVQRQVQTLRVMLNNIQVCNLCHILCIIIIPLLMPHIFDNTLRIVKELREAVDKAPDYWRFGRTKGLSRYKLFTLGLY